MQFSVKQHRNRREGLWCGGVAESLWKKGYILTTEITLSYTQPYSHTHLQVVMELLNQKGFSPSSGLLASGISEILNTDRLLFM